MQLLALASSSSFVTIFSRKLVSKYPAVPLTSNIASGFFNRRLTLTANAIKQTNNNHTHIERRNKEWKRPVCLKPASQYNAVVHVAH